MLENRFSESRPKTDQHKLRNFDPDQRVDIKNTETKKNLNPLTRIKRYR